MKNNECARTEGREGSEEWANHTCQAEASKDDGMMA
jgi:hypothetical protein